MKYTNSIALVAEYPALKAPYSMEEYVAGKTAAERIVRDITALFSWLGLPGPSFSADPRPFKGCPIHNATLAKMARARLLDYQNGMVSYRPEQSEVFVRMVLEAADRTLD